MSVKSGKPERSIQENCAGGRFRVKWGEVRYGVETGPAHAVRAGRLQREGRADRKNAADSARVANFTLTDTALERANRVSDFMEFGELLARDALVREEGCGGHFRVEYQTPDGEAKRDDAKFCHVAAWEYAGEGKAPIRNEEPLSFETVMLVERSYK